MKQCKITVLERQFNGKLVREYSFDDFDKCPVFEDGQVFNTYFEKPDGFCDEAWKAIYQYVFALAHGVDTFYFNDWVKEPGVAICCCNDGLRPVVFKVEKVDGDTQD